MGYQYTYFFIIFTVLFGIKSMSSFRIEKKKKNKKKIKMHPTLDFDPYEVLGVSKTTPTKDIKLIYQQKVLRCHPDKIKNESEVDQLYFHELQRSWEILRDPETRKEYDLRSDGI